MRLSLLLLIMLFLQLQNLNASHYYSSPILSNPACNEEQLVHEGNVVEHETLIQEKDVTIVDRRGGGGGGGGGRGGGGGGGSRGGSGGGGRSSKSGGGRSSRGTGGGLMAGAVAGSHHNHSSVSSGCVHPYYNQLLTTIVVMFNFVVAN